MRKYIAIGVCLAIFCLALLVAASHDYFANGLRHDCTICRLSDCAIYHLSYLSVDMQDRTASGFQSRTRYLSSFQMSIVLPEVPLSRIDARGPPA